MRRAGPEVIVQLDPLLARVRTVPGLREPKPGTFYRGSSAFLHFHEDPAGVFADLKIDGTFQRFRVSTADEQDELLARIGNA